MTTPHTHESTAHTEGDEAPGAPRSESVTASSSIRAGWASKPTPAAFNMDWRDALWDARIINGFCLRPTPLGDGKQECKGSALTNPAGK